tara:strand:+ start:210 stop:539 length:330 start_codon:yes stop_codon:yes gene_type:complete
MIINHMFNPGDIIGQNWNIDGEEVLTALYLIYDKEDTIHCYHEDIGYTSYKCYVLYTYDPYGREDRSGLKNVGETYEITQWNDMDVLDTNFPCDWIKVVQSGLSWEDVD